MAVQPATTTQPGHVLVIGIDGARYDTVCQIPTPGLDKLARDGFLCPVQVNAAGPTISGPGWATVFTGVLASAHQIMDNELSPNRLAECPDIVRVASVARPGLETFVAAGWSPLVSTDSGGPLFAGGGLLPHAARHGDHEEERDEEQEWEDLDEQVCVAAERFVAEHSGEHGSLAVAYLGAPDEVAHTLGVGEAYVRCLRSADARVARLLAAIAARPDAASWTVIAVTDHGHVDAGGHGGNTPEERTAWIAACGPGVPALPEGAALEQADVAAQALSALGIEPVAAEWFGRPFGSR